MTETRPAAEADRAKHSTYPRRWPEATLLSLPLYLDKVGTCVLRLFYRVSGRTKTAGLAILALMIGAAGARAAGYHVASAVTVAVGLLVFARWALPRLKDRRDYVRALARNRSLDALPPVASTLRRLGLDEALVSELVAVARGGERTIAELDQNNRMLSRVGPIPLFANTLIDEGSFLARSRNRTQIVLAFGTVAVKKDYSLVRRFANEVRALDALHNLEGVPTLLHVDAEHRTGYQTFFPGRNLGSLMADAGADVNAQYKVDLEFTRSSTPSSSTLRDEIIGALRRSVDEEFIAALQRLVLEVHRRGVLLRDLKHGNVIACEEGPRLCDFDLACVVRRNDAASAHLRAEERERFNHLFGTDLLTPARLRALLKDWIARNPDLPNPGVYFGMGYRLGGQITPEEGTGKWSVIKRHLPAFHGGRVVDVSGGTAIPLLEMLRAGASSVRAHIPSEPLAELATLYHRFYEFVDNRSYDFGITDESAAADHAGAPPENLDEIALVTALNTPYPSARGAWNRATDFIRRHASRIRAVAIECGAEPRGETDPTRPTPPASEVSQRLMELGFTKQRRVRVRFVQTQLVTGHRNERLLSKR